MEYLDFLVTRDGIKPTNKNIEVITNMNPPSYRKRSMEVYRCSKLVPLYLSKEVTYVSDFNYNDAQQNEI